MSTTNSKRAARKYAADHGITYQQALVALREGASTPTVGGIRLAPTGLIYEMTNDLLENLFLFEDVMTMDEFLEAGLAISFWNPDEGMLQDQPAGDDPLTDWYPLTSEEYKYVSDRESAGVLTLARSGITNDEGGQPVKVLIPHAEFLYDDPNWTQMGYSDLPSREVVWKHVLTLEAALTAFVAPLGGIVTMEKDAASYGRQHVLEVVVPLTNVMEQYPKADDWFAALDAVVDIPDPYATAQDTAKADDVKAALALVKNNPVTVAIIEHEGYLDKIEATRALIEQAAPKVQTGLKAVARDEWHHIARIRREDYEFMDAEATFFSLMDSWQQMPEDIQESVAFADGPVDPDTMQALTALIEVLEQQAGEVLLEDVLDL